MYCVTCTLWDLSYYNGLGNNLIINGYNRGMMGIFRARIDYLGRSRVPESSVDYAGWRRCAGQDCYQADRTLKVVEGSGFRMSHKGGALVLKGTRPKPNGPTLAGAPFSASAGSGFS